jgi:hypothetical protein
MVNQSGLVWKIIIKLSGLDCHNASYSPPCARLLSKLDSIAERLDSDFTLLIEVP